MQVWSYAVCYCYFEYDVEPIPYSTGSSIVLSLVEASSIKIGTMRVVLFAFVK